MRKKICFLTMSLLLMIGYLIAIGAPSLPWNAWDDDDPATGSWTDQGQTVSCDTYVAYNNVWETNRWNVRTYHWARAWNLPGEPDKGEIAYEFRHAGPAGNGYISGDTVEFNSTAVYDGHGTDEDGSSTNNAWEHDSHLYSYHTNPAVSWSWQPYTGIKKWGAGTWTSQAILTLTVPHH